ncbi:MAG: polysaccharide biosynthesis tyrosine autokinase [Bacteroidaceae bacterium]|nr:polysaccharide biosynthesis tyrosine autokinase [Bacteroidaceae bacterium]
MDTNRLNSPQQGSQQEESSFDVTLFFLECLSHWKWFILSLFVVFGLAVFYTLRQVPTYNVQALVLMIDKWSKSESDVLTQSLGITSGVESIFTEMEIMRSRTIIKKVVEDLDLYVSYKSKGGMRNTPLYNNTPLVVRPDSTTDVNQLETTIHLTVGRPNADNLRNIKVNYTFEDEKKELAFDEVSLPIKLHLPAVGTYIVEQVPGYDGNTDEILVEVNNPMNVAKTISKGLKISQYDKNSLLLAVSYNTPIPKMGIDIMNRMVFYYNEDGVAEKNRAANNTELFINNRLVAIQKELNTVEQEVEQYRTQRGLTDLSSEAQMYLHQTGESDKERSELDVQLSLVEYVESYLSNPANTYSPIPSLGIADAGLSNTINEYNKTVAEREKLLNTSSESNPIVQEYSQNILAVKANVLQGVASTRKSIELRKKDISRQEEEIERKIRNVPQYERELTDIMRQQRIKENLFVFLLEKREENALTQTLAVGDARMIDEPTNAGIIAPQKSKIFFLAFVIALLIPGVIIFLKRMMFPSFQDKVELERMTSIPVLAELPHNGEEDFFVVKEKSNGAPSELFRLLRNNIQFLFTASDKKVVMVTSSVSQEGKTFVSSNLAISFALTGKKVLLIGLDIRRPKAAHYFGLSNRVGIVNYLSGQERNIDNLIHPSKYNNLDIMPGGPIPPNPNELLLNTSLDELFAELRKRYDYIIVDSAPVGLVSDSFLIDRVVDINLFVTRAGYTSCNHVKVLNGMVNSGKLKATYLCINDVNMTTHTYSYRRYGYSYGTSTYGSYGYGDDANKVDSKGLFSFLRRKS